ncbi:tetratricopeptide repeat protein [Pseudoduganella chitinolytica]|uniref:Tetratricopeptide repeat protein n=1 Tax=Pseudoduganella chitinolytica TaxID=34070 RepID=A0ABY8B9M3_9BURK|nr:tetratricopeptide repeat protein [Pseudoduganella chitinolytica]WEF32622.1 tetratricopeptide repeat protein [Pseudoduganella chitinolytica]
MNSIDPSDPGALLRQAVAHHQRGELAQAETLYGAVLAREPANFDALHLSGVVARQRQAPQLALDLIAQALAIDDSRAIAHCNLGAVLQDLGREHEALASYERALALQPDYPMALCNRGNALRRLGRLDEALDSYGRALALTPRYPEAFCNRALALQALDRHADALDDFGAALTERPAYAEALHGAGVSLAALEQMDDALEAFDRALRAQPDYADAWCSRGTLLLRSHEPQAALDSYHAALALRPGSARARLGCANALRALGRRDEAVAAYEAAAACGADAGTVAYLLASLGAAPAPQASPAGYVAALFDQYAGRFDRHLVDVLRYRTPALLADVLARQLDGRRDLAILDLGCGTGLCGPLLRPLARHLAGVDLSAGMLAQARELGVYDTLACAELTAYLAHESAHWDVLAAADVLVYIGDLDPVLAAARQALRAGDLFVLSVEALEGEGYALRASGRYAHAAGYVASVAARHGFAVREQVACTLREDSGEPVAGLVFALG